MEKLFGIISILEFYRFNEDANQKNRNIPLYLNRIYLYVYCLVLALSADFQRIWPDGETIEIVWALRIVPQVT